MAATSLITGAECPGVRKPRFQRYITLVAVISYLITGLQALSASQGVCIQVVYGNYYQLTELESSQDMVIDVGNTAGRIIFNMCRFIESRCPGYNNSFAIYRDENICIPLTTDSITQHLNRSLMPLRPGSTNESTGLNLTFTGPYPLDASQPKTSQNFSLQLLLDCDTNATDKAFNWTVKPPAVYMDNGTAVLFGSGKQACPVYSGAFLLDFFHRFFYYIAALAIVVGLVECFYGVRLFKFTMFVTGFLVGFIIMAIFLYIIWNVPDAPAYKGYVIVAFAVLTGLMFGFLVASIAWVGLVLAGSLLGFFAALLIFSSFLSSVVSLPPNLVLYNTLVVGMVIGSLLGFELQNEILNVSCSFSGAYLAVRGVSFYLGGFPAEITATGLTSDETVKTEGQNSTLRWVYYAAIIIFTAAGIFIQQRQIRTDHEAKSAMEAKKRELDAQVYARPDMREMTGMNERLLTPEEDDNQEDSPIKMDHKHDFRPIPSEKHTLNQESPPKLVKKPEIEKRKQFASNINPVIEENASSSVKKKPKLEKLEQKDHLRNDDKEELPAKNRKTTKPTEDSDDDLGHKKVDPKPNHAKKRPSPQPIAVQEESEDVDAPEEQAQSKKAHDPNPKNYKSGVSKLFSSIEPRNNEDSDQEEPAPAHKSKKFTPEEDLSKPKTVASTSTLLTKVASNLKKVTEEPAKTSHLPPKGVVMPAQDSDEEQDTSVPVEEPKEVTKPAKEKKLKPADNDDVKDAKPPKHKKTREQPPAPVEPQPEEIAEVQATPVAEEQDEEPKKAAKEKKDKKDKKDKREKRDKRESEPQEVSEPPPLLDEESAEAAPKAKKKKRKKDKEDPEEEA